MNDKYNDLIKYLSIAGLTKPAINNLLKQQFAMDPYIDLRSDYGDTLYQLSQQFQWDDDSSVIAPPDSDNRDINSTEPSKPTVLLSFSNLDPFRVVIDIVTVTDTEYRFESIYGNRLLVLNRVAVTGPEGPIGEWRLFSVTIKGDKALNSGQIPITSGLPSAVAQLLKSQ